MATQLPLADQEQLDQVRYFWNTWGNVITWVLVVVLAGFAAWNGWNWWQRDQAVKAASIFDELDRAAKAGQSERLPQIFGDLSERYPRTSFAQQGGLIASSALITAGKTDDAKAALSWVADKAGDDSYRAIARLRLAGLLFDGAQYDEALKQLDAVPAGAFAALASDRRGDVLSAQERKADAVAAYRRAWDGMASEVGYRNFIGAKLTALGAAPDPVKADMPPAVLPADTAASGAGAPASAAPADAAAAGASAPASPLPSSGPSQ